MSFKQENVEGKYERLTANPAEKHLPAGSPSVNQPIIEAILQPNQPPTENFSNSVPQAVSFRNILNEIMPSNNENDFSGSDNTEDADSNERHKNLSIMEKFAVYKRKERKLRSLQRAADTFEKKLFYTKGIEEIKEAIKAELGKKRVSQFCEGKIGKFKKKQRTPPNPHKEQTFSILAREVINNPHKAKKVNEEESDPLKTPPHDEANRKNLLTRLSEAPYKKSIIDVPDNQYNSDDEYLC